MFTVRVVHCQPLLMSCVQVFLRDQMMAVSHLVGTDQIPDSQSSVVCIHFWLNLLLGNILFKCTSASCSIGWCHVICCT